MKKSNSDSPGNVSGQRVLRLRKQLGLSQTGLAEALTSFGFSSCGQSSISDIETNQRLINDFQLLRLSDFFGVDMHWLVAGCACGYDATGLHIPALPNIGDSNLCGCRIQWLRELRQISRHTLSIKLETFGTGITTSTLKQIELQQRHVSDHDLLAFSQFLRVDIHLLVTGQVFSGEAG